MCWFFISPSPPPPYFLSALECPLTKSTQKFCEYFSCAHRVILHHVDDDSLCTLLSHEMCEMFSKLLTMLSSTSSDAIATEGRFTSRDTTMRCHPQSWEAWIVISIFYDVCTTKCKRRIIVIFQRRRAGLELTFKFETQSAFNSSDVFLFCSKFSREAYA